MSRKERKKGETPEVGQSLHPPLRQVTDKKVTWKEKKKDAG